MILGIVPAKFITVTQYFVFYLIYQMRLLPYTQKKNIPCGYFGSKDDRVNLFEEMWEQRRKLRVGVHQNSNYPSGSIPFLRKQILIIEVQEETTWFIQNDLQNANTRVIYSFLNSVSPVNGYSLDYLGEKTAGFYNYYYGIWINKKKTLCSFKHFLCSFIYSPLPTLPPTPSAPPAIISLSHF